MRWVILARARSPNRDKAYNMWIESGKKRALIDIADELGIAASQVRKWKSQDNWDGKIKGTLPKKRKGNATKEKKARGAPLGNKNAVGHGAPLGNKNNFKHGLYEEIYWDTLDKEERNMIEAMQLDEEERLLEEQIRLLSVRERRLLHRIEENRSAKGGLALDSVVSRKLEIKGNVVYDDKQEQTETTTRTISTFEVIQKWEAELTRVQARKTRCIESLWRLRHERDKKADESKGNAVANDWIDALIGGEDDE